MLSMFSLTDCHTEFARIHYCERGCDRIASVAILATGVGERGCKRRAMIQNCSRFKIALVVVGGDYHILRSNLIHALFPLKFCRRGWTVQHYMATICAYELSCTVLKMKSFAMLVKCHSGT